MNKASVRFIIYNNEVHIILDPHNINNNISESLGKNLKSSMREAVIKQLNTAKNRVCYSFNKFTQQNNIAKKLKTIFKDIADERSKYGSRYGEIIDDSNKLLLRASNHEQPDRSKIKRSIRAKEYKYVIDLRFFDNTDPHNHRLYKDELRIDNNIKFNVDGNIYKATHYQIDIDAKHLDNKKEFIQIMDAIIDLVDTGNFKHPFVSNTNESYISLSKFITNNTYMKSLSDYIFESYGNSKETFKQEWEKFLHSSKSPMFTFPSGDYVYINYNEEDDCLDAGPMTNTGLSAEYSLEIDYEHDLDYNLAALYEMIEDDHSEYFDENDENDEEKEVFTIQVINLSDDTEDVDMYDPGSTTFYYDREEAIKVAKELAKEYTSEDDIYCVNVMAGELDNTGEISGEPYEIFSASSGDKETTAELLKQNNYVSLIADWYAK